MNINDLLAALDTEIARLQHARDLLATTEPQKRRGRPPASANKPKPITRRRVLSPAARKKIADAQRKRWAKQKAAKPVQVTKVPAKKKPQRKTRTAKTPAAPNALSSRSGTVAVAAQS